MSDGPTCRYCGADCSDGRSYDGGGLYACTTCANWRTKLNAAEATIERLRETRSLAGAPAMSQRPTWRALHNSGVLMHVTAGTPDYDDCTEQFVSAWKRAWPWTRVYVAVRLWRWRRKGCP